jgi:superfamily II DNA helicase RecQ
VGLGAFNRPENVEAVHEMSRTHDVTISAFDLDRIEADAKRDREMASRLTEALRFISQNGGLEKCTELGILSCNGKWCAEQARSALYSEGIQP